LRQAGLDRLNHNLNTTQDNYPQICTTHTWEDRMQTLDYAKEAGLELCSGFIAGMGEGLLGVTRILKKLSSLGAESIPVNFLVALEGTPLRKPETLSPEYCLRILCLARFTNPKAEIRAAGGREVHLGAMQALCLYPANSIFMDGYLNVMGSKQIETLKMIRDAGFTIECEDDRRVEKVFSELDGNMNNKVKDSRELHPTL